MAISYCEPKPAHLELNPKKKESTHQMRAPVFSKGSYSDILSAFDVRHGARSLFEDPYSLLKAIAYMTPILFPPVWDERTEQYHLSLHKQMYS